MKKVLLALCFSVIAASASAQCCPYINGVTVSPNNPTDQDSITVTFTATTPNLGTYLGENHYITQDTLVIDACYYSGLATALQTYTDSIQLGPLTAGTYYVKFVARISSSDVQCIPNGQFQDSVISFTVDITNGLVTGDDDDVAVFPNPADDKVIIRSSEAFSRVRVMTVTGAVAIEKVMSSVNGLVEIDTRSLRAGFYFIELIDSQNAIRQARFIKR
jgi:hypothetical protein